MTSEESIRTVWFWIAAFLMGIPWFAAMLIPPSTRYFLTHKSADSFMLYPSELCFLMCCASLSVALAFRRQICRSRSIERILGLGVSLPFVGGLLFTWYMIILGIALGKMMGPAAGRSGEGQGILEVLSFLVS